VWIGKISYPLYLWHWPLLVFPNILRAGEHSTLSNLAAIAAAFILSALTYYLVERPLRFGRHLKWKAGGQLVTMAITGLLGLYIYINFGFMDRPAFAEMQRINADMTEDVSKHNAENCSDSEHFNYKQLNSNFFCMKSDDSKGFSENVIIGDSHAYPIYFGLYNLSVKERGQGLQMVGANGCPPFVDLQSFEKGESDQCLGIMNAMLKRLAVDTNVKKIFLVNRGPLYVTGTGFGDQHNRLLRRPQSQSEETNQLAYEAALSDTADILIDAGKQVFFLITPPELSFEPKSCISVRPYSLQKRTLENCHVSLAAYRERAQEFRDLVSKVQKSHPELTLLDASKALCDNERCTAYKNGKFFYGDNNHLSVHGAIMVVSKLSKQIPN
jgi:hypothetical protein